MRKTYIVMFREDDGFIAEYDGEEYESIEEAKEEARKAREREGCMFYRVWIEEREREEART